ncbi:MAG: hypothetical protein AB7S74_15245 [Hyphomicrobium sp.]
MFDIEQLLLAVSQLKCCKRCQHAWLNDYSEFGYCKLAYNEHATSPKLIDEMHVCDLFEPQPTKTDQNPG